MAIVDWAELDSLSTVRDWVRVGASRMTASKCFFGHGIDNCVDESISLVAATLHIAASQIETFWDARLLPAEKQLLAQRLQQRCEQRIPTAYLTGMGQYAGHEFICDARALIPRSLLMNAFDTLLENTEQGDWPSLPELPSSPKVLDLCCGGGSIAISLFYRLSELGHSPQIVGSDLSSDALALAKENLVKHSLKSEIKLREGDLFSGLAKPTPKATPKAKFDLIMCNPPYVNALSMKQLPKEYLHEPNGALASGKDGMDFIGRLLLELDGHLKPKGSLLLEIGNESNHFEALIEELAFKHKQQFEFSYVEVPAGQSMVVLIQR
jgi:ribosomal protein L3 glutamine methyltransferase